jgi:hypothetical protein
LMPGRESRRGADTHFELLACPFAGREHVDMGVGSGKSVLIIGPDKVGFRCFAGACADHTFGSLLKLLYERTGRRPKQEIWEQNFDMEAAEKKWGYVENYSVVDSPWDHVDDVMERWYSIPAADRDPSWPVPTRESVAREYTAALALRNEPMPVKECPLTNEEFCKMLGIEREAA